MINYQNQNKRATP